MGLLKHKGSELFPEEQVRQSLLRHLCGSLGFPKSLIAVEKALSEVPHLKGSPEKPPLRRADILCFGKNIHPQHPLYPLLLIECKATPLNSKVINQVVGYNRYVGAYFVAIANQKTIRTGFYDTKSKEYRFIDGLPTYKDLLAAI